MPEDRRHEALPFLRPRIEEPTTIVLFVFVVLCLGIASLIGLYLWRQRRQRIELETRFSKVGTQKGLAPRQILYLLQLAWTTPMKNPLLLLNSVYVFDKIAGGRASELLHAAHQDELMEIVRFASSSALTVWPPISPCIQRGNRKQDGRSWSGETRPKPFTRRSSSTVMKGP